MKRTLATIAAGIIGASVFVVAQGSALAQKKNPLEGQPAVRHRMKLVEKRFEVSPAFESTLNAEFRHTVAAGLKIEYHLPNARGVGLSIGAVGFYGTSFNTGLVSRILKTLPETSTGGDPTPTKTQYSEHLNKMPMHGAAYFSVTPWYGKLAAFGKAFVNFDFYFTGGLAFAQLKNDCDPSVCTDPNPGAFDPMNPMLTPDNPNDDPPLNDGFRVGPFIGGGIHVFLNHFVALDLTIRDYIFSNNPSGLDFNADLAVCDGGNTGCANKEGDSRILHHMFVGVGVSIFFPPKVQRTP